MTAPAADRPTFRDGHLLLDRIVADEQLPAPTRRAVQVHPDGLAFVLTLADRDDLRAWHAHLHTTDLEPHGPYRVAARSVLALVGRLRGVATTLEIEVAHEDPAEPGAIPPAPAPQAPLVHDGATASERTEDHDTAGWRAAIEAAGAVAARINHRVASLGGDR